MSAAQVCSTSVATSHNCCVNVGSGKLFSRLCKAPPVFQDIRLQRPFVKLTCRRLLCKAKGSGTFDPWFATDDFVQDVEQQVAATVRQAEQQAYTFAKALSETQEGSQANASYLTTTDGLKGYRREFSHEQQFSNGYQRTYYSEMVTYSAPQVPYHNSSIQMPVWSTLLLFVAAVVASGWASLTVAFNKNYKHTTFLETKRWKLVLLWPVLFATSKDFRQKFLAALRGNSTLRAPLTTGDNSSAQGL